jgi:hypothetical protein
MKRSEIQNIHMALLRVQSIPRPVPIKFAYALTKNLKSVSAAAEASEVKRQALLDEHVAKDEDGKRRTTEDKTNYVMIDKDAFEAAFKAVQDEDVEVEFHMIKLSSFPPEIEPGFVTALSPLIDDSEFV